MLSRIFFLVGILVSASQPASIEEQLAEAAQLQNRHRDEEALSVYLEILRRQTENFQALTGASYLYGRIGSENTSKRREYYPRALELAQEALRLQPEHPESHLVMAWALGGNAQMSGARKKVRFARQVKTYIDRSLEQRPEDHRAWYILANWHYKVSKAGFWERAAAKVLFGGLPSEASLANAAAAYEKALERKPGMISYRCELARALVEDGRKKEAAPHLETALALPAETLYQIRVQGACRQLLKSLGG